jgi:hypothetical protein
MGGRLEGRGSGELESLHNTYEIVVTADSDIAVERGSLKKSLDMRKRSLLVLLSICRSIKRIKKRKRRKKGCASVRVWIRRLPEVTQVTIHRLLCTAYFSQVTFTYYFIQVQVTFTLLLRLLIPLYCDCYFIVIATGYRFQVTLFYCY